MKNQKLQNLEEKFNLAEQLITQLDGVVEGMGLELQQDFSPDPNADPNTSIMDMNLLSQDFLLARNNIIKLIHSGQRILDSANLLDLSDLKATQLEALSNLQTTIGNNITKLLDCHKEIANIEKARQKPVGKKEPTQVANTVNQNLFVGSSSDLLKLINENSLPNIKEVN